MESAAPKGDTSDSPVREQSNSTASNIVVNSNGVETKIRSGVCHAMDTVIVEVESAFARGFAGVQLIGNVSDVCRNGKERARAALEDLGYHIPPQKVLINLSPGDVRMDGNHLDLPVALSLSLIISGAKASVDLNRWLFVGELGLFGEIKAVKGVVSFAIAAAAAGFEGIVVPQENLPEISALQDIRLPNFENLKILAFENLEKVVEWIRSPARIESGLPATPRKTEVPVVGPTFDDMFLSELAEKAVVVAAAGLHSMLLRGTPGSGKSMLAARLPSIMPAMERGAHIESMRIHSNYSNKVSGALLKGRPPYRAPHHHASAGALLGTADLPGELSLAHGGVLFLDEFPEFRRDLLESLREPLETGEVSLSRTRGKVIWKSRILLIGACNNCPCGWTGSRRRRCECSSARLIGYRQKLSGPMLDRIDIHLNMPELPGDPASIFLKLQARQIGKQSSQTASLAKKVATARSFGRSRNLGFGVVINRDLPAASLVEVCGLTGEVFGELVNRILPASTSNRSIIRTLRVARSLADVEEQASIREIDLRQAWEWQAEKAAVERGERVH